jgi:RNA polymerase primary sigma factor
MDAPIAPDEENTMYDVLCSNDSASPDKDLMKSSLKKEIERALATLTPREASIIQMYYGLNGKHSHTLDEIGEGFYLTRERVRQIKEDAIRRLKKTNRSKILKTYLGQ